MGENRQRQSSMEGRLVDERRHGQREGRVRRHPADDHAGAGTFTREQALDAEIERLADALRSYLEAFRESLLARSLIDAVNRTEVISIVEAMMDQLQDRVKEADERLAGLEAERNDEIQQ